MFAPGVWFNLSLLDWEMICDGISKKSQMVLNTQLSCLFQVPLNQPHLHYLELCSCLHLSSIPPSTSAFSTVFHLHSHPVAQAGNIKFSLDWLFFLQPLPSFPISYWFCFHNISASAWVSWNRPPLSPTKLPHTVHPPPETLTSFQQLKMTLIQKISEVNSRARLASQSALSPTSYMNSDMLWPLFACFSIFEIEIIIIIIPISVNLYECWMV